MHNLCQTRRRGGRCVLRLPASAAAEQQLFLRHLPRSRHSVSNHCQPWHSSPLTSISHFIMSHHNSRRLAGSALLGVSWRCSQALSMLADLDAHRSRRWQPFRAAGASGATGASGAGGILVAAVCSWCGWTKPPHHMPPRSQSARPLSTPKQNKQTAAKNLLQRFPGISQAFCRLICLIFVDISNACPSMPRIFRTNRIWDICCPASKVLNRV